MNSAKKVMNQQKDNSEKKENVTVKAATGKKKLGVSSGRNVKAIVLSAICIVLVLVLCIGVGIQQLGPEVAFTVNGTKVTMDDMMYPIYEKESYIFLMMRCIRHIWELQYGSHHTREVILMYHQVCQTR